ncbi:MAG: oligopeptide:H+ symporter, partial [Candidatus Solibacter sp.]|nr:oligopeptide:H+ symporter [Candidatus Solibacter sp.]
KAWLAGNGFDPTASWHWGFGAAGVGMIAGLVVFFLRRRTLETVGHRPRTRSENSGAAPAEPLTAREWSRVGAIFILFTFTIFFWAAYEQKGASLNLFAKQLVRTQLFGWEFPASWLQSLTPFYVILLAPVFARLWVSLGDRQPTSPTKFALGLAAIGCAFCLLVPASALTASGKISPLWFVAVYFLDVCGEMCLSPVGLSTVTKVAPVRFVGLMMGAWFFATSLGNKLAGYLSGFFVADDPAVLMRLYGGIAAGLLLAAAVLALTRPYLRRLMGPAG